MDKGMGIPYMKCVSTSCRAQYRIIDTSDILLALCNRHEHAALTYYSNALEESSIQLCTMTFRTTYSDFIRFPRLFFRRARREFLGILEQFVMNLGWITFGEGIFRKQRLETGFRHGCEHLWR